MKTCSAWSSASSPQCVGAVACVRRALDPGLPAGLWLWLLLPPHGHQRRSGVVFWVDGIWGCLGVLLISILYFLVLFGKSRWFFF